MQQTWTGLLVLAWVSIALPGSAQTVVEVEGLNDPSRDRAAFQAAVEQVIAGGGGTVFARGTFAFEPGPGIRVFLPPLAFSLDIVGEEVDGQMARVIGGDIPFYFQAPNGSFGLYNFSIEDFRRFGVLVERAMDVTVANNRVSANTMVGRAHTFFDDGATEVQRSRFPEVMLGGVPTRRPHEKGGWGIFVGTPAFAPNAITGRVEIYGNDVDLQQDGPDGLSFYEYTLDNGTTRSVPSDTVTIVDRMQVTHTLTTGFHTFGIDVRHTAGEVHVNDNDVANCNARGILVLDNRGDVYVRSNEIGTGIPGIYHFGSLASTDGILAFHGFHPLSGPGGVMVIEDNDIAGTMAENRGIFAGSSGTLQQAAGLGSNWLDGLSVRGNRIHLEDGLDGIRVVHPSDPSDPGLAYVGQNRVAGHMQWSLFVGSPLADPDATYGVDLVGNNIVLSEASEADIMVEHDAVNTRIRGYIGVLDDRGENTRISGRP